MPKFIIERDLPGAGEFTEEKWQGIGQKSCSVLDGLGPEVQWVHSFVTDDKLYCIYISPNAEHIREHAKRGGFPCNRVSAIRRVLDPHLADLSATA